MEVIDTLEEELNQLTTAIRLKDEDEEGPLRRVLGIYSDHPTRLWIQDEVLETYLLDTKKLFIVKRKVLDEVVYHGFWIDDTYMVRSLYQRFSYPYERNLGLNEAAVDTQEKFLTCVYNAARHVAGTTEVTVVQDRLYLAACRLIGDRLRSAPIKVLVDLLYAGIGVGNKDSREDIEAVFLAYWQRYQQGLQTEDAFAKAMSFTQNILPVFAAIVAKD